MDSIRPGNWFHLLWLSQSTALLGSEITIIAIPLLAVLQLNATPSSMGVLIAAEFLPMVALGLFVGVAIDRIGAWKVLILTGILCTTILVTTTIFSAFDFLSLHLLIALVALFGAAKSFHAMALTPFVQQTVAREHLVDANGKFGISRAFAEVGGVPLSGFLVQLLSAAGAVLVGAASYLVSIFALWGLRSKQRKQPKIEHTSVFLEIHQGIMEVLRHPIRRYILFSAAIWNFFYAAMMAVYIFYLSNTLGIKPLDIGIVLFPGGIGVLLAGMTLKTVSSRLGLGMTAVYGICCTAAWAALVAVSSYTDVWISSILMLASFCFGLGQGIFNGASISIMQIVTPTELMGRVTSSSSVFHSMALPFGALVGGWLGENAGVEFTTWFAAFGITVSAILLALSPAGRFQAEPITQENS